MKTRIITGVVALCILFPILYFADTVAFPIAFAVCSVLAVYEMLGCIGLKKSVAISAPLYFFAVGFPMLIRFAGDYKDNLATYGLCAAILCALWFFAVVIFSHGKYSVDQIGVCFFSLFYIILGFSSMIFVHDYVPGGKYVYLISLIGAWVTDTFAYFCGMLFGRGGKHKLIPDVSPKKTVEGAIGGIVFCMISMLVYGIIVEKLEPNFQVNLLVFVLAGFVVAIVSQIGDLAMSVVKRRYGIKDYGWIFPGHGGILDRFDSVIAVSVLVLVLTSFFRFVEEV